MAVRLQLKSRWLTPSEAGALGILRYHPDTE